MYLKNAFAGTLSICLDRIFGWNHYFPFSAKIALALLFILGKSVSGTKLGPKVVATIYLAQIVLPPSQYFFLNMLPIPESIVIFP